MNLTEEEREQYEEQLQELDEKTLLIQAIAELGQIRRELEVLNQRVGGTVETQTRGETESVTCKACLETVPREDRKQHAVESHGAPKDMPVEDLGLFE
jgi:uncharacterized protein (DUF3084 family)